MLEVKCDEVFGLATNALSLSSWTSARSFHINLLISSSYESGGFWNLVCMHYTTEEKIKFRKKK